MTTKSSLAKQLQVESLAILLHPGLPLPLCSIVTLASGSSNALVDSPQLQRESRAELLQTSTDAFYSLKLLSIDANNALFRLSLFSENITVPPHKDVISLVVECRDLSALELRFGWEQGHEQLGCQQTKRSLEIVEKQLWVMNCRVSVAGQFLSLDPVGD
ncbi:hypothetical protein HG530_014065 [Fusarium avenaceum]|nr:hypothetical protein HG530_014065 [Fusarium avenaceum]